MTQKQRLHSQGPEPIDSRSGVEVKVATMRPLSNPGHLTVGTKCGDRPRVQRDPAPGQERAFLRDLQELARLSLGAVSYTHLTLPTNREV